VWWSASKYLVKERAMSFDAYSAGAGFRRGRRAPFTLDKIAEIGKGLSADRNTAAGGARPRLAPLLVDGRF
jgi:hypothetical protein